MNSLPCRWRVALDPEGSGSADCLDAAWVIGGPLTCLPPVQVSGTGSLSRGRRRAAAKVEFA